MCYSIKNSAPRVLSVANYLGFLEFLVACNLSPRAVANYASGIKSYLQLYQLPHTWIENPLVKNYLRAVNVQVSHVPRPKSILSLQDLCNVSITLSQLDNAVVYRAAILLSYYGFFRISNLVPPTQHSFDVHRQLTWEDVFLLPDCVHVHLKWAKNLQKADQSHDVYLTRMNNAWLCPHATLNQLF